MRCQGWLSVYVLCDWLQEVDDNDYQTEESASDDTDSDIDLDENEEVTSDVEVDGDEKRKRRVITKAYKVSVNILYRMSTPWRCFPLSLNL